jgi:hypothetical protein
VNAVGIVGAGQRIVANQLVAVKAQIGPDRTVARAARRPRLVDSTRVILVLGRKEIAQGLRKFGWAVGHLRTGLDKGVGQCCKEISGALDEFGLEFVPLAARPLAAGRLI